MGVGRSVPEDEEEIRAGRASDVLSALSDGRWGEGKPLRTGNFGVRWDQGKECVMAEYRMMKLN